VARWWAIALSVSSGSKRRRSTSVEASGSPSVKCANPHEWNIGAATIVASRAFNGIFENSAAAGSSESGCLRAAPLGVPVVPEVRITTRPFSAGGVRGASDSSAISASIRRSEASSGCLPGSCQATKRLRPAPPSAIRSLNSSS
jgi:hypothetical protein